MPFCFGEGCQLGIVAFGRFLVPTLCLILSILFCVQASLRSKEKWGSVERLRPHPLPASRSWCRIWVGIVVCLYCCERQSGAKKQSAEEKRGERRERREKRAEGREESRGEKIVLCAYSTFLLGSATRLVRELGCRFTLTPGPPLVLIWATTRQIW